jgi:hypothetical protein
MQFLCFVFHSVTVRKIIDGCIKYIAKKGDYAEKLCMCNYCLIFTHVHKIIKIKVTEFRALYFHRLLCVCFFLFCDLKSGGRRLGLLEFAPPPPVKSIV